MKIIIDGDSFPYKKELLEITEKFKVHIIIVLSLSHYFQVENEKFEMLVVDNVSQEADIKIFNLTSEGDLVITEDLGLGSIILSKKASVITTRGKILSNRNIDGILNMRHKEAKLRKSGHRTKGPGKISAEDKERFCKNVTDFLLKYEKRII